jgi:putative addiction module component (TIGR02574 family)
MLTVDRLSPEERLALIGELWDSLNEADIVLTPAQQGELDRRLAAMDDGNGVAWPELRAELRKRLG